MAIAKDLIIEELGRKYTEPKRAFEIAICSNVEGHIKTDKNRKQKFIDIIKENKNLYDVKDFIKTQKILDSDYTYNIMMPYIVGLGGVGSSLVYLLQNFKYRLTGGEIVGIQAMDDDTWELSNIPRLMFYPDKINKKESCSKYCETFNNEDNFNYDIFYHASHIPEFFYLPIGAMDLYTRSKLYETYLPFVTITHKDNLVQVKLNPEPINNLELARETYGLVDIEFFHDAMAEVSIWLKDNLFNPDSEIYQRIYNYKQNKFRLFMKFFEDTNEALRFAFNTRLLNPLFIRKYKEYDEDYEKWSEKDLEKILFESMINMWKFIDAEYIENQTFEGINIMKYVLEDVDLNYDEKLEMIKKEGSKLIEEYKDMSKVLFEVRK